MTELPEGVILPTGSVAEPRPSAAAVLSRGDGEGLEILLCHRVSEVPAFPDFWAFPGGGISRIDRAAGEENPDWFIEREDRFSMIAILREMVEEVGIAPDGNGGFFNVGENLQNLVNSDKSEWTKLVASGELSVNGFEANIVSQRTTPPLAPIRFSNIFYHVSLGTSEVEPTFPTGLSEFDEFRWWKPIELLNSWLANKVRLAPPQVTLIRDIVDLGFESLGINPPRGYHIIEFAPGVECVPLPTTTLPPSTHTNCYVLGISGGPRILVDPAARSSESLKILENKVSEIHDSGSEIIATVFTHKHPDHIGNLSAISQFYQAPIWASQETLGIIPNYDSNKVIEEGDTINLDGIIWDVIETPGHCPGHICLVGDAGIISGDNAVMFGTILVPSSDGDMNEYLTGLERIRRLSPTLLFPAHGPLVANPDKLLTRYIKHRTARHSRVLDAVKSGFWDVNSIANKAYEDTPDAHPALALDQTISHLTALEKSGNVSSDNGLWSAI